MTYWHMQLHPDDLRWEREEELLEKLSLVGLGLCSEKQIDNFIKNVKLNDIILIKQGSKPIALVEVEGELEDNFKNDLSDLDWFRYRRKVVILDIYNKSKLDSSDKPQYDFPSPRGTLTISKDTISPTYQYILNWHKSLFPELYQINDSLKIREVSIHNYKILKDFKIDFTKDNKPLPIIVVAGINGSGKTTLLEYIKYFTDIVVDKDRSYIKIERYNKSTKDIAKEELRFRNLWNIKKDLKEEGFLSKIFKERVIYLSTGMDIKDLKVFIASYIQGTMHKQDLKPSDVFDTVREKINNIFKDLNMLVEFEKVDADGNIFFKNKNDESFSIDDLSTGEKTLLSKVLYLYLKEIKDKVVLIDEPELSLHPSWQNKILKLYENFAKENNCQIIIATHSPHIIGSAKSEWVRILTEDCVVDDFSRSYGFEFDKILTDVMGVENLRTPDVAKKIRELWSLLEDEDYQSSKYLNLYKELENMLGSLDKDLILARLEVSKLKKQNA